MSTTCPDASSRSLKPMKSCSAQSSSRVAYVSHTAQREGDDRFAARSPELHFSSMEAGWKSGRCGWTPRRAPSCAVSCAILKGQHKWLNLAPFS